MKFEENLRELRKQNGYSQEELADKLNVSRQAVSKWENGSGYPELDKLMALCDLFRTSLDELLKGDVRERDMVGIQKYDLHCNRMAKAISFGVFMVLLGIVSGAFLEPYFVGEQEDILGITFFVCVAIGVLVFIYYGMQSDAFQKKYPKKPHNIYTEEEIEENERKYRISMVVGVGIILISFAVQILLDLMVAENIANGVWMFMIDIAVVNFVYFGMMKSKFTDTIPKSEEELAKAKRESKVGKWCGCIMIGAVIVYLTWSFMGDSWDRSWLVFPIAGLLCGIASIVLSKEE